MEVIGLEPTTPCSQIGVRVCVENLQAVLHSVLPNSETPVDFKRQKSRGLKSFDAVVAIDDLLSFSQAGRRGASASSQTNSHELICKADLQNQPVPYSPLTSENNASYRASPCIYFSIREPQSGRCVGYSKHNAFACDSLYASLLLTQRLTYLFTEG
jgi:hypothetical protein